MDIQDNRLGKRLLNTEEAAAYVGRSISTMNKLRLTGEGCEYVKLGRSVRYEQEALDRYVASGRRRSTSEQAAA